MKQFHGLDILRLATDNRCDTRQLAALLLKDLQQCQCRIYGCIGDDDKILLATLSLLPDTLLYDAFDRRIDFVVVGPIIRNDCVPLTYRLQGQDFAISGRCSMIARVCGVDLYLQASYTGIVGDIARQKFSMAVKPLLKQ
ncbi:MAG: hypothetical protein PHH11_04120 [Methylomonas sp.]|nr:hypothetical protein [Methylomonas sp.]